MNNIIFGIPRRTVHRKETLSISAIVMQIAPTVKGQAFKMQFTDPAIDLMSLDVENKPGVIVATIGEEFFLVPVDAALREKVPAKDICMVYRDGSLSNKRLYNYLAKSFSVDITIKNTFSLERKLISSDTPDVDPVVMYKLVPVPGLDQGQTSATEVKTTERETTEEVLADDMVAEAHAADINVTPEAPQFDDAPTPEPVWNNPPVSGVANDPGTVQNEETLTGRTINTTDELSSDAPDTVDF